MFLDHSTALNKSLAANSQILSMPTIFVDAICMGPYLDVWYGSALKSMEMYEDRYVVPERGSPAKLKPNTLCGVGGTRPL